VAGGGELLPTEAAGVLELHRKTGRLAKATDGSWHECETLGIPKSSECPGGALDDRRRAVLRSATLVERRQVDVGLTRVLAGQAASAARHCEEGVDVPLFRALQEIFLNPLLDLIGAVERRSGRQPELHRGVSLVLGRDEARRERPEEDDQEQADPDIDQQEQPLALDHASDVADVPVDSSLEARIELLASHFDSMRDPRRLAAEPRLLGIAMLALEDVRCERRAERNRQDHR